jgi:hypothetical protein
MAAIKRSTRQPSMTVAGQNRIVEADQALLSVGQISSDFRKACQALESKIFRFTILEIRIITSPVSRPQEGRIMIVTTRWMRDAVDAFVQARFLVRGRMNKSVRRSRVVLAPRRWRQACGVIRK